ncbi:MAG: NTP transferase domain-containing protein [Prevotellaceae bacterium]|jgi:NDP-sugar pyrophosphorylase family protein|nr:NTP transferase domain-containing protein [Prevotellaceae bacterium]
MKAMIFSAGLGTRLKPITDTLPKALVSVGGKPLLEHVIEKLKSSGFADIVINVHHFPDLIIDFLQSKNNFNINILISDERQELLNTGGGIVHTADFFEGEKAFLVHNVDILSNINLTDFVRYHRNHGAFATLVASPRETSRYFLFDDDLCLKGWTNIDTGDVKPANLKAIGDYRQLAFSGIQLLSAAALAQMKTYGKVFSVTDFYISASGDYPIKAYIPENYQMIDVGKPDALDRAEEFIHQKKD